MSSRTPRRQTIREGSPSTRAVDTPPRRRVVSGDGPTIPSRHAMSPAVFNANDRIDGDDDQRAPTQAPAPTGLSRSSVSFPRIVARLADLARDMEPIETWPAHDLSALWCQLAALQNVLAARCLQDLVISHETQAPDRDHLLTVGEAAARLACSTDWLYRHHPRLGFAVRNGRHLRFSADGLERYIRERAGREQTSLPRRAER